jgi:hypothetical protein
MFEAQAKALDEHRKEPDLLDDLSSRRPSEEED